MSIVIIDYKIGNANSILNMLKRIGQPAVLSDKPEDIAGATKLILPGVGHFTEGMKNFLASGLKESIEERVLVERIPILGICLGMQLMTGSSEEGNAKGLGWIDAETVRFDSGDVGLKVPHMGWNEVQVVRDNPILNRDEENRFYFVHSYYVKCHDRSDVLATSFYGSEFTSSFSRENIFGVQFHPEKSHVYGMKLLERFAKW